MNYDDQRRACYMCRKIHDVGRVAEVAWVGQGRILCLAFLCSNDCWADLVFETPPEISNKRRVSAINELLANANKPLSR